MGIAHYYEQPASAEVTEKGSCTYKRKWLVEMATLGDRPPSTWAGLPVNRYDPYPTDSTAIALTLSCDPVGDQVGFYEVTISYGQRAVDKGNSDPAPTPSQTDQSVTPTSRPWVIKFGSVHGTRILGPLDLAGTDVTNSAGQPFDPPIEIPCSNLTISITAFKAFAGFDPVAKQTTYQDTINNAAFALPMTATTFAAKTLRCTEYNTTSETENGVAFYQVEITLEYRPAGWQPKVLDAGTVYWKSHSLPPQPIIDEAGNPITTPIPLDGAGGVLKAGDPLVYKTFRGYTETGFGALLT